VNPSRSPREGGARRYTIWVCPVCGQKYNYQPGLHRMAGDDLATSCFHNERSQPRLVKLEVVPESAYLDLLAERERTRATLESLPAPAGLDADNTLEIADAWEESGIAQVALNRLSGPLHYRRGEGRP
jgi:hypothetical protein